MAPVWATAMFRSAAVLAVVTVGLIVGAGHNRLLLLVVIALGAIPLAIVASRWSHIYAIVTALALPTGMNFPSLRIPTPFGQFSAFHVLALYGAMVVVVRHPQRFGAAVTTPLGMIACTYAAMGTLSAAFAGAATSLYWVITGGVLLMALAVLLSGPYSSNSKGVLQWTVVAGVVLASSVLIERLAGGPMAWLPASTGSADPRFFRGSGLVGNPVVAGAALAVVFAILIKARPFLAQAVNVGCAIVVGAGAVATGSRSALGGVGLALLAVTFSRREAIERRALMVFAGILFGIVFLSQLESIADRLGGSLTDNVSNAVRERNLSLGWSVFRDNPVWGIGLGNYRAFTSEQAVVAVPGGPARALNQIDNTFLTLLAELGGVGVLAIVMMLLFVACSRRPRSRGGRTAMLAPLITWFGVSYFFDALYHESMLVLFVVVFLMWRPPDTVVWPRGRFRLPQRHMRRHIDRTPLIGTPGTRARVAWPISTGPPARRREEGE